MLTATSQPAQKNLQHQYSSSRRNFLKSFSLVAAGVAIGLPLLPGCKKKTEEDAAMWQELGSSLQGNLMRPFTAGFQQKAAPWALQYNNLSPNGIAECVSREDVRTCILWAKKYGIPIVARSGGHSYGGYSTTTGLMIDMSSMNEVAYNPASMMLRTGGGARNKHVFAVGKTAGVAITHGRCFEVGVAGLTLGGGIGFDMRRNGYTCDKLVETEMVLANGSIVTCNATQNEDLFWACRGGGGGNFGINTSFTFEAFSVGQISVFNIEWDQKIPELLAASQVMIAAAPNTFGLKLAVSVRKEAGINKYKLAILGSFEGNLAGLQQILAPMMAVQLPTNTMMEEAAYWDGQEKISEEGKPEYAHERSRFVNGYLNSAAIQTIVTNLESWPGTSKAATWKFFLMGGAINDHQPADMAIVHRGYTMLSSVELEWTTSDSSQVIASNEQWLTSFHNQMATFTSNNCYQNFIDPHQDNYLQAYYGQNLAKLKLVKAKYDPENLFTYAQAIPIA